MENQTLQEKREGTLRRILEAAREVFAEKGFAGARVDAIAKRAGVNKATIYYHIGDKEALYARVLHDVFSGAARSISEGIHQDQDPEEKLRTYIRKMARTVGQHHHVPPIIMRELASGARNIPDVVAGDLAGILGMLAGILREGADRGVFIEANPLIIHIMVVGSIISVRNLNNIKTRHPDFPEFFEGLTMEDEEDLVEQVERVVLHGVRRQG
jgi:AcrR family transcriptional regulator